MSPSQHTQSGQKRPSATHRCRRRVLQADFSAKDPYSGSTRCVQSPRAGAPEPISTHAAIITTVLHLRESGWHVGDRRAPLKYGQLSTTVAPRSSRTRRRDRPRRLCVVDAAARRARVVSVAGGRALATDLCGVDLRLAAALRPAPAPTMCSRALLGATTSRGLSPCRCEL